MVQALFCCIRYLKMEGTNKSVTWIFPNAGGVSKYCCRSAVAILFFHCHLYDDWLNVLFLGLMN
jgi:hypothetical protein